MDWLNAWTHGGAHERCRQRVLGHRLDSLLHDHTVWKHNCFFCLGQHLELLYLWCLTPWDSHLLYHLGIQDLSREFFAHLKVKCDCHNLCSLLLRSLHVFYRAVVETSRVKLRRELIFIQTLLITLVASGQDRTNLCFLLKLNFYWGHALFGRGWRLGWLVQILRRMHECVAHLNWTLLMFHEIVT